MFTSIENQYSHVHLIKLIQPTVAYTESKGADTLTTAVTKITYSSFTNTGIIVQARDMTPLTNLHI